MAMPARSCLVEIFAQVLAPSGLRHREPFWPERVNRSIAVAPRIAFGCAPLPSSRRIGVRADIGEERPSQMAYARRGSYHDGRRRANSSIAACQSCASQAIAQVAHVAKG